VAALDRALDTTPEPVILTILHRRLVELIGLADRLADGTALPDAARAIGVTNEFRARTLAGQARRWSVDELSDALTGLLELDAMVKGVPGSASDPAQRRLAFLLWVGDQAAPAERTPVAMGPGRRVGPG
jgi:DNA polymerase III delta subunit